MKEYQTCNYCLSDDHDINLSTHGYWKGNELLQTLPYCNSCFDFYFALINGIPRRSFLGVGMATETKADKELYTKFFQDETISIETLIEGKSHEEKLALIEDRIRFIESLRFKHRAELSAAFSVRDKTAGPGKFREMQNSRALLRDDSFKMPENNGDPRNLKKSYVKTKKEKDEDLLKDLGVDKDALIAKILAAKAKKKG
jgi:hypothetical protein